MEATKSLSIARPCLDIATVLQCQAAKLGQYDTLTSHVFLLFSNLQPLFIRLPRLRVFALITQRIPQVGQQPTTLSYELLIFRPLPDQRIDHVQRLTQPPLANGRLPTSFEAASQSMECCAMLIRPRSQRCALRQLLDARQQLCKAAVGGTQVALLPLVLTQAAFS